MKKKWAAAAVSTILSLSLAACSTAGTGATKDAAGKTGAGADRPGAAGDKAVEITYWNLFGGGDGDFMDAMVKKFNETHKDSISVKSVRLEWGEYYTKLSAAISSGSGPDVAVSHASRLPELVGNQAVTPLEDIAKQANVNWGSFNENILSGTEFDGKHYAIPLDTHAQAYFYNKKLLKDYGLLGEDGKPKLEPGTEGFMKFLSAIKEKSGGKTIPLTLPTAQGSDIYWLWWTLYKQAEGESLFSSDGSKAGFNNEQGKKALHMLDRLIHKDKVLPGNLIPDNFQKLFEQGKAATGVMGVWATGALEKAKGLDFGVMPVPTILGKPAVWGDSHTIILPKAKNPDAKKQNAAVTFADWLSTNGAMWSQAGHIPAKKDVLHTDEFKKQQYRSDYASTTANNVRFFTKSPKIGPVGDEMTKVFNEFASSGKLNPDDALSKAEAAANKVLAK